MAPVSIADAAHDVRGGRDGGEQAAGAASRARDGIVRRLATGLRLRRGTVQRTCRVAGDAAHLQVLSAPYRRGDRGVVDG